MAKTMSMLKSICPKLPMRDKRTTRNFYTFELGFNETGKAEYPGYLMLAKESVEIHFFEFKNLNPLENYGQVYIRVENIESLFQKLIQNGVKIHPNGFLETKSWGQKEFSILDPDNNLLTFGEEITD